MPFPNAKRGSSLCTRTRARVPRECGMRESSRTGERERERERVLLLCSVEGCIEAIGDPPFCARGEDARFDLGHPPIDPLIAVCCKIGGRGCYGGN